jgi:hypothetical protein
MNTAIDNTDEATWAYTNLFYQRWIHYEAPGEADGPQRLAEMLEPLDLTLTPVALPEPSRAFGLGVALPWLAWLGRRRARRRESTS